MDRPLLAFFGHHRCATTYVNDILRQVCREFNLRHITVPNPRVFNYDLRKFVEEKRVDFLAFVNADDEYVRQLDHFRGFHVVRDPRDVCVSAYYSSLYSHPLTDTWPELIEHRRKLQGLSEKEGLLLEIQFREHEFNLMYNWNYSLPNVLELKFEEFMPHPYQRFLEVFRFLGILDEEPLGWRKRVLWPVYGGLRAVGDKSRGRLSIPISPERFPAERLLGIVWENDFARKAGGRQPGQEETKSHYRKGVAGDWRNHFEAEHIEYFKDHHNEVLIKLGYEQHPDWE